MVWWRIPPLAVPTQTASVLSPKNLSENGTLIETLKIECHGYYPSNLVHLYQPLIEYSYGNLVFSSPIPPLVRATLNGLSNTPAKTLLVAAGVSTSGTIPILGLKLSKLSMNAPF